MEKIKKRLEKLVSDNKDLNYDEIRDLIECAKKGLDISFAGKQLIEQAESKDEFT